MAKRRICEHEDGAAPASAPSGSRSDDVFAKRSTAEHAAHAAAALTAPPVEWLRPVDVKAFGLEDRAEAVIATGKSSWSLASLSKWRSESLAPADAAAPQSSREYVRQRQRAYRKQCLAPKPATQPQ